MTPRQPRAPKRAAGLKGMILAAGVGSRLRPLTDRIPKALIEVGGVPMLEIVARRLRAAGVTDLVVNAHHHAQLVADFAAGLKERLGFARVDVTREDALLLDTGGGLLNARELLDEPAPFLLHNADVLSDVDLAALLQAHERSGALATLAVRRRPTKRALRFSDDGRLLGRAPEGERGMAFCGIHAISPALFGKLTETGVFSITDAYARLAAEGADIRAFVCDQNYWADIGGPEKLTEARKYALAHPDIVR